MAGYIINLDSEESLSLYIRNGVYATKLSVPKGKWRIHHEGTFADYATMAPGDNIYFFIKRRIFGIGVLVNVGIDCKFGNFPQASEPIDISYDDVKDSLLWDEGKHSVNQRWICTFRPSPHFFKEGIDMDQVLASSPTSFRMLRAFWKVSFLKFDDIENQAFKDAILKANQHSLNSLSSGSDFWDTDWSESHSNLSNSLKKNDYSLTLDPILSTCASGSIVGHEMALEAGLLFQMSARDENTLSIFGDWDYLSHQVIASPFKPIDYMDKMDVFGYSFIRGFEPTRSRYFVVEIKKDLASKQDIDQLMKYVDWVKNEYCHGDYSMIVAFLVASGFAENCKEYATIAGSRKYTLGHRPAETKEWQNVGLVRYRYDPVRSRLIFTNEN